MRCLKIFSFVLFISVTYSCDQADEQRNKIQVRFIEQICCGSLLTLDNDLITSPCKAYQDSLLAPINPGDFPAFQNIQVGDIFTIEYELTEGCEAACEITCNRMNGIPIKLLQVEN